MSDRKTNLDKEEWEPVPGYEWLLEVEPWEGVQKTAFIEHELACLWSDLERAERHSLSSSPTIPSMEMEGIMDRISYATSIVGPVDWKNISMVALVNGGYEAWAKYMDIDYNLPTEEELSEIKTSLEKGGWG